MKKKSIYFIAPLIGLVIFGAIYWNFQSGYLKKQERIEQTRKQEREAKARLEADSKKQAYDEAIAAQVKRKKEREEKDKKDQEERDARQMAYDDRNKAQREVAKLEDSIKNLTKQLEEVKKEIADLDNAKKLSAEEEDFQRKYAKQAEVNRQSYAAILVKIQEADKAAEEAARAAAIAAAAAKKKQ